MDRVVQELMGSVRQRLLHKSGRYPISLFHEKPLKPAEPGRSCELTLTQTFSRSIVSNNVLSSPFFLGIGEFYVITEKTMVQASTDRPGARDAGGERSG